MGGNDNQLFKCKTFRGHCTDWCRQKRIYEALEIIHSVAGCAYNNLINMIGLSCQLQTFKIWTCSKKCILSIGHFPTSWENWLGEGTVCRHVMLTNGGIKAVKTFSGLSVTVGEMMSLYQEESVSAAKFDRSLFCSTDRHEAINQSCAGLGWGRIWILDSGWWG